MATPNPQPIMRIAAAVNEYAVIGVGYQYAAGNNFWQIGHVLFDNGGDGEIHGDMILPVSLDQAEEDVVIRLPIVLPEDDGAAGEEVRFRFYAEEHAMDGGVPPDDDTDGTDPLSEFSHERDENTDVSAWLKKRIYLIQMPITAPVMAPGKYYKWYLRREMGVVTTDYPHPVLIRHPHPFFKS